MTVRVLFFAYLREITQTAEAELEVAPGASVRDVRQAVVTRWPALDVQLTRIPVVVDERIAELDSPVHEGAEVAWLPPVGGGSGEGGAGVIAVRITGEPLDPASLLARVSDPSVRRGIAPIMK